ncbi:Glutathione S-transferase [Pleurostoma richardsiae]|uniref:Glutathione S-transferase n=1 Tax=Pleurostoma richardsiae TaxID=41990 RepID=A0AA38SB66_9PEZI|nr:Glutathione S-transferase [Pleurostoma richardsiae]
MSAKEHPIVLYHYAYSPFARRVVWYLALRGIPYSQCMQPPIMPRPDIAALGINHRRIPILSIGRDVYFDTRLIIQKLEQLDAPGPALGARGGPESQAIERLLESFVIDGGVFSRAAQLIPPDLPLLRDPAFGKDRVQYNNGRRFSREEWAVIRPEALGEIRAAAELLEATLLADGRDWILKTEGPSLADIEAVWPLHWLAGLPGALPPDQVSAEKFPKVFAWIDRFQQAVTAARKAQEKPATLPGDKAKDSIAASEFWEAEEGVDENDPVAKAQGLKKGSLITVWPTDTGSSHRDTGVLVGLSSKQVVIETKAGDSAIRVHAPRHGFRICNAERASHL